MTKYGVKPSYYKRVTRKIAKALQNTPRPFKHHSFEHHESSEWAMHETLCDQVSACYLSLRVRTPPSYPSTCTA